jgi:hypothetical protein
MLRLGGMDLQRLGIKHFAKGAGETLCVIIPDLARNFCLGLLRMHQPERSAVHTQTKYNLRATLDRQSRENPAPMKPRHRSDICEAIQRQISTRVGIDVIYYPRDARVVTVLVHV